MVALRYPGAYFADQVHYISVAGALAEADGSGFLSGHRRPP